MESALSDLDGRRRREAFRALDQELTAFTRGGLVRLRADLPAGRTLRRSWDGCVLSYREGGAGASRRDSRGRAHNAFTVAWDAGEVTDEEVVAAVARELRRRAAADRPAGRRTLAPDRRARGPAAA